MTDPMMVVVWVATEEPGDEDSTLRTFDDGKAVERGH